MDRVCMCRVCMVRVCYVPSLLWAEFVMWRVDPTPFQDVHSPDKLSDRDIVSGTVKIFTPSPPPTPIKKPRRKVYLYQKGDYESMRKDTLEGCKGKILQWSLG